MRLIILLFLSSIFTQKLSGQINDTDALFHRIPNGFQNNNSNTESTGYSLTGSNIDVVYHRLNFTANPDDVTKTLTGLVTTYFKTIESNVATLSFDLNKTSFNNSNLIVTYHGQTCTINFPSSGNVNILQITLPNTISNQGTLDSITINYQGVPPAELGAATGYQRDVDNVGNNYIYTLSESYEDRDWWPCKADMQDKIDSLDIIVTVPSEFWVASNGIMIDSSISGLNKIFTFKHRYPIASYLVSLGIAKYKKLYLGNIVSGNKSVPFVVNYFPDKSTTTESSILNYLNNHKLVFNALSNLFGDYPFNNEKHGFYEFGFSGGMEHQTFSGLSNSAFLANSIMTHELAHQWWGDKVTFNSWSHLWLAEGFATYSEALAYEFVPAIGLSEVAKMSSIKTSARNNSSTPIFISNIASSNTIWTNNNTIAIYNRGCMVASMLRALLGDTKFFTACKNYLSNNNLAYKTANTNDLQIAMEQQFGDTLTSFFNEWIYKKGTPNYNIQWGNNNKRVNIQLNQTVSSTGASFTASNFFSMPVILKISDTINGFDTTVILYHQSPNKLQLGGNGLGTIINGNIASYNLSFIPNKIVFDAASKTMANATVTYSTVLPLQTISAQFTNNNKIEAKILTNNLIEKVEVQQLNSNNEFKTIGLMQLSPTKTYTFKITENQHLKSTYRIVAFTSNGLIYSNILARQNFTNNSNILLFPNPAYNEINLITSIKFDKIIIKTLQGKIVQLNNNVTQPILSISNLPSGIYFVEIFSGQVSLGISKFTKK
jgi:aminopeptidase N